MKLQQLGSELTQDLLESKYDNKEIATFWAKQFRETAAKYELAFNVNMDFPRITKDKAYFKVTLKDAEKGPGNRIPKEERLDLDLRVRAFTLKGLAKDLKDLMKTGHKVQVVAGGKEGGERIDVTPETVADVLHKAVDKNERANKERGPTLGWFVYLTDDELTSKQDSRTVVEVQLDCNGVESKVFAYVPSTEAKMWKSKAFYRFAHMSDRRKDGKNLIQIFHSMRQALSKWVDLRTDVSKDGGINFLRVTVRVGGFASRRSKEVPAADIGKIIDIAREVKDEA